MDDIAVNGTTLHLANDALRLSRNVALSHLNALSELARECTVVAGQPPEPLQANLHLATALYAQLDSEQANGSVRLELTPALRQLFAASSAVARGEHRSLIERNVLRQKLGEESATLTRRASGLLAMADFFERLHDSQPSQRTLSDWLQHVESPRLALIRKSCRSFLDSGHWLDLRKEAKEWSRPPIDDDVFRIAKTLYPYARLNDQQHTLELDLPGLAICPDAAAYLELLVNIALLGVERFAYGIRHGDAPAPITESDLSRLAPSLSLERIVSLLDTVSWWLRGQRTVSPYTWVPDRHVLRLHDAISVDQIVDWADHRESSAEEALYVMRAAADFWLRLQRWPHVDSLLVGDEGVGPSFASAMHDLTGNWIEVWDHKTATLDLDGLLLAASDSKTLLHTTANLVGTLADNLDIGSRASFAHVHTLAGESESVLRSLLPLLNRSDLGITIWGANSGDIEVEAGPTLAHYQGIRTPSELARRWQIKGAPLVAHGRNYQAGTDPPNPFEDRTLVQRLQTLNSRPHGWGQSEWLVDSPREQQSPSAIVVNWDEDDNMSERFQCVSELGEGVHGEVWRYLDTDLKRHIAVKFIRTTGASRNDIVEHARAVARVTHPNIVAVYDVTQILDPVTNTVVDAVVMELVEGTPLTNSLRRQLDLPEAKRIALSLTDAIRAYHAAGLAHMDLHSANVIVGPVIKVLDPLYFDTALFGSTATREAQQARDLRSLRDILVQLMYATTPLAIAATFERDTHQPTLTLIDTALEEALRKSHSASRGDGASTTEPSLLASQGRAEDVGRLPDQFQLLRVQRTTAALAAPPRPLEQEGPLMVLQLVPLVALNGAARVDLTRDPKTILSEMSPYAANSWDWFHDVDSIASAGVSQDPEQRALGYTRLSNSGALEYVALVADLETNNRLNSIVPMTLKAFTKLVPALSKLGLHGGCFVSLDIMRTKGCTIKADPFWFPPDMKGRAILRETLAPPHAFTENPTASDGASLFKASFDWIWRAAGYEKCFYYDEHGTLTSRISL